MLCPQIADYIEWSGHSGSRLGTRPLNASGAGILRVLNEIQEVTSADRIHRRFNQSTQRGGLPLPIAHKLLVWGLLHQFQDGVFKVEDAVPDQFSNQNYIILPLKAVLKGSFADHTSLSLIIPYT